MSQHPEPIEGESCVPWEPLGQIDPDALPEPSDKYPGPWDEYHRGNGHVDILDGQDRIFAHVYCWDGKDWAALSRATRKAMQWAIDNGAPMRKAQALYEMKRRLLEKADKIPEQKISFGSWEDLLK
jgi:hypothetical protein